MNPILRELRRMALVQAGNSLTDAELLEAFLSRRDEDAFEALLRRHAPMVLGVCRRILRHAQDAEDAFQATFLVLAQKAASLRSREVLGHWLYRVAFRTALKARTMNRKRRLRESQVRMQAPPETPRERTSEELLARLDTAINRLPEKYRVPVVLCELEGKSRQEVAALLGLPPGTLSSRLARARKLLARRLGTHVALSGGMLTVVVARDLSAAVAGPLLKATARAGLQAASGQLVRAGAVSAPVLTLTESVMRAMVLSKLKGVGAIVLALAVGVGGLGYRQAWGQASRPAPDRPAPGTLAGPSTAYQAPTGGPPGGQTAGAPGLLEQLQLEVAALRKGLDATRQRVLLLEQQLNALSRSRGRGELTGSVTAQDPFSGNAAQSAPQDTERLDQGSASKPTQKPQGQPVPGNQGSNSNLPPVSQGQPGQPVPGNQGSALKATRKTTKRLGDMGGMRRGQPPVGERYWDNPKKDAGPSKVPAEKPPDGERYWDNAKRDAGPQRTRVPLEKTSVDPLSLAQAALNRLRDHPGDKRATDTLEHALRSLREQQTPSSRQKP